MNTQSVLEATWKKLLIYLEEKALQIRSRALTTGRNCSLVKKGNGDNRFEEASSRWAFRDKKPGLENYECFSMIMV